SAIAKGLLHAAGVNGGQQIGWYDGGAGGSGGHAWNWVSVEHGTYWVEPQSDPTRESPPLFFNRQNGSAPDPSALGEPDFTSSTACRGQGYVCHADADCCSGLCASGTCDVACGRDKYV